MVAERQPNPAVIVTAAQVWILAFTLLSLFSLLDTLLALLRKARFQSAAAARHFRGLKLVAAILIGIMIVSLLMGKSPLLLLSGSGAMTAVLMLVFRIRSSGWWPAFSSPPTIC